MSEPTNEELVAAARAVVEMWRESHLYTADEMHDAFCEARRPAAARAGRPRLDT